MSREDMFKALERVAPEQISTKTYRALNVRALDPQQVWDRLPAHTRDGVELEDFRIILRSVFASFAEIRLRDIADELRDYSDDIDAVEVDRG